MSRALQTVPKVWWVTGAVLVVVLGLALSRQQRPKPLPIPQASQSARQPEAVAALGRLEPAGDVRRLAAPISGIGGSPRLTGLLVEEGDAVRRGQLLARFDTAPTLVAQQRLLDARLSNLDRRLQVQTRDIGRYRQLSRSGAIPSGELDTRETALLELQGQRNEAWAERERIKAELLLTELRAPIDGVVLKLHARVGERPGDAGVLELGASMRMQAVVEVYESDIDRVQLGQSVSLISENGGFQGTLHGEVIRISPQVRQRSVLSTDPTGDADARVVDVRVALNPADSQRVKDLTGLKVIARLGAVAPGVAGTGG
ncbi:efflux RND transporter periplasmic adaptor subunit [Cyanobium sp. T1B-Tous]|uniref:HlyD family efflux transporter periplasmic adaptor subunit n=1 Tax=Cyanobium sp. T1B-Tous TaxID=2823721 RepID=UPI0020CFC530|nr:HlyD family efflux transporter periplasmic adaptor subunit [Cyanobium sp. T1B-Tous]MCP9805185.1 efflux RND transporter periplasmic adaptor subunit [Cyanobium sp. T1B-Tous]